MSHQNLAKVYAPTLRRGTTRSIIVVLIVPLLTLAPAWLTASARAANDETVGDTLPVSLSPEGAYANDAGTAGYGPVSIADDGRYVAFESSSTNLGEAGPGQAVEAFVKDLDTGAIELASRASGSSGEPANEPGIEDLKISGDGRYVIFTSRASDLVSGLPGEEPEEQHVYRRDLRTGETILVDRVSGVDGAILSRGAVSEAISADGRYVVFAADAADLEDPAGPHTRTAIETVYVRDMQTGTTTAVSRADGPVGAVADQESQAFSISPDGRYVPFVSRATNLLPGMEANIYPQIYLRDLQTGTTALISQAPSGEAGEGRSEDPVLVGSGGCEVQFSSEAHNLLESSSIEIDGESIEISGPQAYLRNLCSTPARTTLLSQNETGIAGAAYGVFGASADASEILFAAEFSSGYHLFLRDPSTHQTSQLDRSSGPEGASANREVEQAAISANGCRAVFDTQASNLAGETGPPEGPSGEVPTEVYVRQLAACEEEPAAAPVSSSGEGDESHSGESTPGAEAGGVDPQGVSGQSGTSGPPDTARAAQSTTGPRGAQGARGPVGPQAKVTCRLAHRARRISCSVNLDGKKTPRDTRAKLTRGGRIFAHGPLATLRASRRIHAAVYTLRLTTDDHRLAIRVRLR